MPRTCTMPDCSRPHEGRGLCKPHWYRFNKYGDPLAGPPMVPPKTKAGAAQDFLRHVVFTFEGEGCLEWPFSRDADGYARCGYEGRKTGRVGRYICSREHGPPPTPQHEAAHSCGNSSCISRHHLSWKTPAENNADKLIHGTMARGERHAFAKLTSAQVHEIRSFCRTSNYPEIAKQFGVTSATIRVIDKRISWAWLEDTATTMRASL